MNSVEEFLKTIENDDRLKDSRKLIEIMSDATATKPVMWGSIIGFGKHHYKYETGREGDTVAVGFSPRKNALVLYGVTYYDQGTGDIEKLGKYKLGKGCLYINKLSDVDTEFLLNMTTKAFKLRNN